MEQLKEQEKHLLQLLARESELSTAEKEQLMKQLELWEQKRAALELEAQAPQEKVRFFSFELLALKNMNVVNHSKMFS